MKTKWAIAVMPGLFLFFYSCGGKNTETQINVSNRQEKETENLLQKDTTEQIPQITFVELGSVNCIPCRKMQPVMTTIEKKYAGQVKVVFYDVLKSDQKKYAQDYGIRLIPTQVFLDKDGKEIMRHEGFFSEVEIDIFLKEKGLTPKRKS